MAGPSFREWLATRLAATAYASNDIPDDKIDEVAVRLGVQPDLLLEVRAADRVRRAAHGLSFHRRTLQCELWMPQPVFKAWKDEAAYRGVDGRVLFRSLIHEYLLAPREPAELLDHWVWNGRAYRVGSTPFDRRAAAGVDREKTKLTVGAWRALKLRASRLGVTRSAIMRALVLETMRGEHRTLTLVQPGHMFDDETRYYLG